MKRRLIFYSSRRDPANIVEMKQQYTPMTNLHPTPVWFALISAAIWGVTPLMNAASTGAYGPKTTLILCNLMFAVVAALIIVATGATSATVAATINGGASPLAIVFLTASLSTFAQYLVLSCYAHHPAALVVALSATSPLFTAALAYLLRGETLGYRGILGLLMTIAGIILITSSSGKKGGA